MTLSSTLSQIPTEMQVMKSLEKIIFPKGIVCPNCGRKHYVQNIKRHKLWRCKKCRNKFSLSSVTWLKGMKISYRTLWTIIWAWQIKLPIQQCQSLLGRSIPTIRRYYELFRDNLKLEENIFLTDTVQMDEMFVKGAFILGAKDIKKKKIVLKVIKQKAPSKNDAMNFIFQYVVPKSTLCTDGGSIYKACEKWWPLIHKKDIHRKFEFAITSEIEGIWANLRTFIRRMYHHVTLKNLSKIVAEFQARFSQPILFHSPLNFLKNSISSVTLAL